MTDFVVLQNVGNGLATNDGTGDPIRAGASIFNGNHQASAVAINRLAAAQVGGSISFLTKTDMDADLDHADGTIAWVTNDSTDTNNQAWRKSGASGTGNWAITVDRVASVLGNGSGFQQGGLGAVVRTFQAKSRERITPTDFGGICDGGSNPLSVRYATLAEAQADYPFATALTNEVDWCALQAAVNHLSDVGGGTVEVPNGRVALIHTNVTWASNVALKLHGGGGIKLIDNAADLIRMIDARRNLSNIAFYGPGFIDGNATNQASTQRTHGIGLSASGFIVDGIEVKNIHCYNGSLGDCIDLEPDLLLGTGGQCRDFRIVNCLLHDAGRNGVSVESGINGVIAHNTIYGMPNLAGVDIEPSGGTIGLVSGISVNDNNIRSSAFGVQVVSAAAPASLRVISVSNNVVSSCGVGIQARACDTVKIKGNMIDGATGQGIWVYTDAATTVANCEVEQNTVANSGSYGIQVQPSGGAGSSNVAIRGNQILNSGADGIRADSITGGEISGNLVDGAQAHGVTGISLKSVGVLDNRIREVSKAAAGSQGVNLQSSASVTVGGINVAADTLGHMNYGLLFNNCAGVAWRGGNVLAGSAGPLFVGTTTGFAGKFTGFFTMPAANSANVNSKFMRLGARVSLFPENAAAAALMGSAKALYHSPANDVADTSFRVVTANAAAALGTEVFGYVIDSTFASDGA